MKVSRQKTEHLCVGVQDPAIEVKMQGQKLKKVQEFKYLGSTIQRDRGSNKEIANRIQAKWNAWLRITGILCDRKVQDKLKGRLFMSIV